MQGLKLNHVSKRRPWSYQVVHNLIITNQAPKTDISTVLMVMLLLRVTVVFWNNSFVISHFPRVNECLYYVRKQVRTSEPSDINYRFLNDGYHFGCPPTVLYIDGLVQDCSTSSTLGVTVVLHSAIHIYISWIHAEWLSRETLKS